MELISTNELEVFSLTKFKSTIKRIFREFYGYKAIKKIKTFKKIGDLRKKETWMNILDILLVRIKVKQDNQKINISPVTPEIIKLPVITEVIEEKVNAVEVPVVESLPVITPIETGFTNEIEEKIKLPDIEYIRKLSGADLSEDEDEGLPIETGFTNNIVEPIKYELEPKVYKTPYRGFSVDKSGILQIEEEETEQSFEILAPGQKFRQTVLYAFTSMENGVNQWNEVNTVAKLSAQRFNSPDNTSTAVGVCIFNDSESSPSKGVYYFSIIYLPNKEGEWFITNLKKNFPTVLSAIQAGLLECARERQNNQNQTVPENVDTDNEWSEERLQQEKDRLRAANQEQYVFDPVDEEDEDEFFEE